MVAWGNGGGRCRITSGRRKERKGDWRVGQGEDGPGRRIKSRWDASQRNGFPGRGRAGKGGQGERRQGGENGGYGGGELTSCLSEGLLERFCCLLPLLQRRLRRDRRRLLLPLSPLLPAAHVIRTLEVLQFLLVLFLRPLCSRICWRRIDEEEHRPAKLPVGLRVGIQGKGGQFLPQEPCKGVSRETAVRQLRSGHWEKEPKAEVPMGNGGEALCPKMKLGDSKRGE